MCSVLNIKRLVKYSITHTRKHGSKTVHDSAKPTSKSSVDDSRDFGNRTGSTATRYVWPTTTQIARIH